MDGHDADDAKKSTADMTAFVQNLLQQMNFQGCFTVLNYKRTFSQIPWKTKWNNFTLMEFNW
ncbi:hypothetical protein NC653_024412 [Populus alba x Populus x berolinensis]|uniref:Uncharacterized protein n=1 Tax=Populus alba x Populus x berolinensis TaxID=444605 RepID=A0AAD6M8Q7_9ROSI|nr:hypothetical protein NC653_024412 [Populus alba x Populus x berolinensis]